jgi:NurA-like 5'-3' nuclease
MLYIGHFSFDEMEVDKEQRHGYFTCIVDSMDVEQAVEEFKSLIEKLKSKNKHLAGIVEVYIEDIFEIQKVPETAMMIRMQSSEGEFPESVSRSLPFAENPGVTAYGWAPDIRKTRAAEKDEVLEMEPFLSFA